MGRIHESSMSVGPLIVTGRKPIDVRTVVEQVKDLKERSIMTSAYSGMIVYVTGIVGGVKVEEPSLYICHTENPRGLTNVEDGWRKLDVDYSTRVFDTVDKLTDGTILLPYQGIMAYVTSESALYILTTKGADSAKDINNWKKISLGSDTTLDKVGINVEPEGGSGFMITENKDVIVEDYVNVENYIKEEYFYTSKGVNSFDADSNFTYDYVRLSKGSESYIELYTNSDNWMVINDPDGSLGLSVSVNGVDYEYGTPIAKETFVCFGSDIQFTDGWTISYGDVSRPFIDEDYELIDIYRSEYSPEVYAHLKDIDIRLLTEDDLLMIDDKIDNLANSIMIDLGKTPSKPEPGESDGSDSDSDITPGESDGGETDVPNTVPLQQVIVNMNNSISKLEQTVVEPEPIDFSDINQLFS